MDWIQLSFGFGRNNRERAFSHTCRSTVSSPTVIGLDPVEPDIFTIMSLNWYFHLHCGFAQFGDTFPDARYAFNCLPMCRLVFEVDNLSPLCPAWFQGLCKEWIPTWWRLSLDSNKKQTHMFQVLLMDQTSWCHQPNPHSAFLHSLPFHLKSFLQTVWTDVQVIQK